MPTASEVLVALATGNKVGIAVVAGVFVAFALASSFLLPAFRPQFPGRRVGLFVGVTVLLTAGMLATIIVLAVEPSEAREAEGPTTPPATTTAPEPSPPATTTAPETAPPSPGGDAEAGRAVFTSAGCGSCHTLQAAGTSGTVGPNLDEAKPPEALVVDRVTNGKGVMPPFRGQLSEQQIQDVAAFVTSAAGS
jgi:mono/diheme cytochrome c family protein